MRRILQVYPVMNNAGTEMVIMNLYRNIDRNKIQFDFLVQEKGALDDEIILMGGRIHYIQNKSTKEYYRKVNRFLEDNKEYKVIHIHTHAEMPIILKAAKKQGIKCRIAHSHNSRQDLNKFLKCIKAIKSIPIRLNSTHFFACSREAGKWLFPFNEKDVQIIKNGINLEKFKFNIGHRVDIRKELGIGLSEKVICHVGRFSKEKNHEFLIDVCNKIIKKDRKIKVILVGTGPLINTINQKITSLNLKNNVIMLGNRNDVFKIMSAADLFLFPSLHEGLGIVMIEAQTNGLPCIVSGGVPEEADMNISLYHKINEFSYEEWIESILEKLNLSNNRIVDLTLIKQKGYDISQVVEDVQKIYLTNSNYDR